MISKAGCSLSIMKFKELKYGDCFWDGNNLCMKIYSPHCTDNEMAVNLVDGISFFVYVDTTIMYDSNVKIVNA